MVWFFFVFEPISVTVFFLFLGRFRSQFIGLIFEKRIVTSFDLNDIRWPPRDTRPSVAPGSSQMGWMQGCEKTLGFCYFCPKPRVFDVFFLVGFGFLLFLSNLGLQREFIQATTKSNHCLIAFSHLQAKPKHIGQKYKYVMHMKKIGSMIHLDFDMRYSLWNVNNTCSSQLIW